MSQAMAKNDARIELAEQICKTLNAVERVGAMRAYSLLSRSLALFEDFVFVHIGVAPKVYFRTLINAVDTDEPNHIIAQRMANAATGPISAIAELHKTIQDVLENN